MTLRGRPGLSSASSALIAARNSSSLLNQTSLSPNLACSTPAPRIALSLSRSAIACVAAARRSGGRVRGKVSRRSRSDARSPPLHNHGGYENITIAALKSLRILFDSNFGVIKPLDEIRRSFGFVLIASSCKGCLCRGVIRPPLAGSLTAAATDSKVGDDNGNVGISTAEGEGASGGVRW